MKRSVFFFVAGLVLVAVVIVLSNIEGGSFFTAGNGGWNLKQMNDTSKTSVVAFAEANTTSDQNLAQGTVIMNYEHLYGNGMYVGADLIGCVSTEFGVVCPTYDMRAGLNFANGGRLELKCGNFTRNSVKTSGFDPQFMNFTTISGDPASVSNAVQLSYTLNGTKVMAGHQAGSKFYQFNDGNYYVGAEQRIGNFSISGGADFSNTVTGYAAAQVRCGKSILNVNCNKLGSDSENYIFSYNYNGINLGKGFAMNVGSALYLQTAKSGLHVVTGICKGSYKLFAEAGGYKIGQTVKPLVGMGLNVKL
jgi:hypothetical protein